MGREICMSYEFLNDAELYTCEQITPWFESQMLRLKKNWKVSTYTINIHFLSLY